MHPLGLPNGKNSDESISSGHNSFSFHPIPFLPVSAWATLPDREQPYTLSWPLRTHRNLIFLQTCQLGPWESDPLLDCPQDWQWHFRVGTTQIPASLVPPYAWGHLPWHFKAQLCSWGACCPQNSCCQHQWKLSKEAAHWVDCPSEAPKVPIRDAHGWQIQVQIQLDNYLRFR